MPATAARTPRTMRDLDAPIAVPLSPRECFALAALLEADRTLDALADCLAGQQLDPDAADDAAEHVARTLREAPYRLRTTLPVRRQHARIVWRDAVRVAGVRYAHEDLACLHGEIVHVTPRHVDEQRVALVTLLDGTVVCIAAAAARA